MEIVRKLGGGKKVAVKQSFKRTSCTAGDKPVRTWKEKRCVTPDHQSDREGDYSPSVTLALKLAGIFEVSVEDIFSYADEEDGE